MLLTRAIFAFSLLTTTGLPLGSPAGNANAIKPFTFANGIFLTGQSPVRSVTPQAVKSFYLALRLAEDNPQNFYTLTPTLNSEHDTLEDFERDEILIRKDPGIREGDIICVGAGELTSEIVSRLVKGLILTSVVWPAIIATGIGVSTLNPLLGVPAAWTVAVTGSAISWGAGKLAGSVSSHAAQWLCTLVRTEAPDPSSASKPAITVRLAVDREYPGYTENEQKWRQFRDRVDFLKRHLATRPGTDRKAAEAILSRDKAAFNFRDGLHQREQTWQDYQLNKYAQILAETEKRISTSNALISDTFARNVQVLKIMGSFNAVAAESDGTAMAAHSAGRAAISSIRDGIRFGSSSGGSGSDSKSDTISGKIPIPANQEPAPPNAVPGPTPACDPDGLCVWMVPTPPSRYR